MFSSSKLFCGFSCSYVPMFGETDYDPDRQYSHVSFDEQLDALGRAVDAGKVGNQLIISSHP